MTLEEKERLDRIRQLAAQTADEIEHYEKLKKLEQLLRKRIKLYKDSPPGGSKNWRVNEQIYELLAGLLKEAGLE